MRKNWRWDTPGVQVASDLWSQWFILHLYPFFVLMRIENHARRNVLYAFPAPGAAQMMASFHLEKSLFRFSSFTRGAQNGRAANELKRMLLGSKVYLRASVIIISKVIAERDPTTHKESCASTKRILYYGYADRLRATNLSRLMSGFCFVVRPLWPTWYSPFCIVTTWKKNGVGDGPQPMGLCVGLGGVQEERILETTPTHGHTTKWRIDSSCFVFPSQQQQRGSALEEGSDLEKWKYLAVCVPCL